MTDNEIIKALECCVYGTSVCKKCHYNYSDDCQRTMMIDILDLINRQKTEIERLNGKIGEMCIEDIEHHNEIVRQHFADVSKMVGEIKSEALNEFVKTLKLKSDKRITTEHKIYYRYSDELLDKLLKEMVGEENA